MTNLLILGSHAVLEYDDLRLFSRLGYDVFQPGAYSDPIQGTDIRPGVPEARNHPELAALVVEQRERHAGEPDGWPIIDWGKADLHPKLIEWADIIMVNCFPESWIAGQWDRIREKRVIWRTIGQSDPQKETFMRRYARAGLQIVRYSPAEKRAFEKLGAFAGEDAMIRFAKDPADYGPWTGDGGYIASLAQHDRVKGQRDPFLNWQWVTAATEGLPFVPAGPNSEVYGGLGLMSWDATRDYLSKARAMAYSGTQPASYTLGLMEAMLTGLPVVSIGPNRMWIPDLFEAHEIVQVSADDPSEARMWLTAFLDSPAVAAAASSDVRSRGVELFSYDTVGPQWLDFLGAPVALEVAA